MKQRLAETNKRSEVAAYCSQTAYRARNEHPQTQESLGDCSGSCETDTDASDHDVYVRQLSTNILDLHGIQPVSSCEYMSIPFLTRHRFKGPIQGVMQTNNVFSRFESAGTRAQVWGVKIVYILMQMMLLGLGIYKVNSMGLLPTTRSDWLAWETERQPLERAYFAFD